MVWTPPGLLSLRGVVWCGVDLVICGWVSLSFYVVWYSWMSLPEHTVTSVVDWQPTCGKVVRTGRAKVGFFFLVIS